MSQETVEQRRAELQAREVERLNKAVDDFAAEMKKKLIEYAENGKRGWDYPNKQQEWADEMAWNVRAIKEGIPLGVSGGSFAIDAANYAMFIWFLEIEKLKKMLGFA